MNSDDVVAVSDQATDALAVLFNTEAGKQHLRARGVEPDLVDNLCHLGLSSIANLVAAIKLARYHRFGPDDVIVTVATDGAELYQSEIEKVLRRDYADGFDQAAAAAVRSRFLDGAGVDHVEELGEAGRRRIFNLGYYTWVEQQGVPFAQFEARRQQGFWTGLHPLVDRWDTMIEDFNARSGATFG